MFVFKKIISLLVCVAIFFSLASPCLAAGPSSDYVGTDNWNAWMGRQKWINWVFMGGLDFCGSSDDGHHRSTTYDYLERGEGDLVTVHCTCDYCGDSFETERNDFDSYVSQQYQNYAASLPTNGYASDNSLLWYPTIDDLFGSQITLLEWRSGISSPKQSFDLPFTNSSSSYYSFTRGANGRSIHLRSIKSLSIVYFGVYKFSFTAPCSGSYRCLVSCAASASGLTPAGETVYFNKNYTESAYTHVEKGFGVSSASAYDSSSSVSVSSVSGEQFFPVFSIIPDDVSGGGTYPDGIANVYQKDYRMGNIGGNYGVVNNDNSVTNLTTNNYYIVNETENTYNNPITGTSDTITNWNYNYDNRSYELTLQGGDITTVTYGDEYVTINETTVNNNGDTITNNYTVYYIVPTGNEPDPDPSPDPSPSPSPVPSSGTVIQQPATFSGSRVFKNYSAKITQNYGHDGHGGTDCIPSSGVADTVIAHSAGVVVWTQTGQKNNQGSSGNASYGNAVKIRHPNGYFTLYAHLDSVAVEEGDYVYRGQPIGVMGNTGNSYGAHLHFEVRDTGDTRINSDPYLLFDLPGLKHGEELPKLELDPIVDEPDGEDGDKEATSIFKLLAKMVNVLWDLVKGLFETVFGTVANFFLDLASAITDFFSAFRSNPLSSGYGVFDFNKLGSGGADLWE